MDSDKLIFAGIGGFTLLILVFILGTSFLKQPVSLTSETLLNGATHKIGATEPKLILVEFSDFECPACKSYVPVLNQLLSDYPEILQIVYRHFPIPGHLRAVPSARASEASSMQGKFWEYHDVLFTNQPNFSDDDLMRYAADLGLDVTKFEEDYKSAAVAETVKADFNLSTGLNLRGTPSFFAIYDSKVEEIILNANGDLEKKVAEILGEPLVAD